VTLHVTSERRPGDLREYLALSRVDQDPSLADDPGRQPKRSCKPLGSGALPLVPVAGKRRHGAGPSRVL
jgi:hypothetical protein